MVAKATTAQGAKLVDTPKPTESGKSIATGSVEGRITLDGNPLANLKVELAELPESEKTKPTTQTDADGKFAFADVLPGSYLIVITVEGEGLRCVFLSPTKVNAGEQFTRNFTFDRSSLLRDLGASNGGVTLLPMGVLAQCVSG
jgi:hypothetical protein